MIGLKQTNGSGVPVWGYDTASRCRAHPRWRRIQGNCLEVHSLAKHGSAAADRCTRRNRLAGKPHSKTARRGARGLTRQGAGRLWSPSSGALRLFSQAPQPFAVEPPFGFLQAKSTTSTRGVSRQRKKTCCPLTRGKGGGGWGCTAPLLKDPGKARVGFSHERVGTCVGPFQTEIEARVVCAGSVTC